MKRTMSLLGAAAIALAPGATLAKPASNHGASTNAATPTHGQKNVECEDVGDAPGQSDEAPGGGSPFIEGNSVAGSHYAGEQPGINDKNSHSVSQYDVACSDTHPL